MNCAQAAIRDELANSALQLSKRVEQLSRAVDVCALHRLFEERRQYVQCDVHWAYEWHPIVQRVKEMKKALEIELMALVQETPLSWEERAMQGVVPRWITDIANGLEQRIGCLGSADFDESKNQTVYALVLSGCAWVAAEQDVLADCYLARKIHFDETTALFSRDIATFSTDRVEAARKIIYGSMHRDSALQVAGIEYGFETLPKLLSALDTDMAQYGPLVSDASTRDFLRECQTRHQRLDIATAAFLKLCRETEERLERAYRRRKAKELMERREMQRLSKAAALRIRESKKRLRKVDKSGVLADPYTLVGRIPSKIAENVQHDRRDVVDHNTRTLRDIDNLLGSGLDTPIDVMSEVATQTALEELTLATLSTVEESRKAEGKSKRYALKVKDTKDVLTIVKPTLAQLLGQTIRGDSATKDQS